jgi:hypothetical protein
MNQKYTEDEKKIWEEMYISGLSSHEISRQLNISKATIYKHLQKCGITRNWSEWQKGKEPWNKGLKGMQVAWNKGINGVYQSSKKGKPNPSARVPCSPERAKNISNSWKKKLEEGWDGFGGYGRLPTREQRKLPSSLYLVRYIDDEGTHFKLGITVRNLQERLKKHLVSIVDVYESTLGECFDIEQEQLKYAKENGWRYSSHSTTELIKPEGVPYLLEVFSKLKCSSSSCSSNSSGCSSL